MFEAQSFPFPYELSSDALYNASAYLGCYPTRESFRLVEMEGTAVIAQLNLTLNEDKALNAPFSGFGGIENDVDFNNRLYGFVESSMQWCKARGLKKMYIKSPSLIYNQHLHKVEKALVGHGFEISCEELNQHIIIDDEEYINKVKKNEKKRLRKCEREGFRFKKLSINELEAAYAIIRDNRVRKSFPMTVDFSTLHKMFITFPENYLLFGVYDGERLVAVAVSIRVTDKVLYNFYHGDVADYREYSPVVMIIKGVYDYCCRQGINCLDLGISSVEGVINEGLYQFKTSCGAQDSPKRVWVKDF